MRPSHLALSVFLTLPLCAGGIAKDKQLHLAAGLAIGASVTLLADGLDLPHPERWGSLASILAGALKEYLDRRKPGNYWNGRDLGCTAGAGIVVSYTIRF